MANNQIHELTVAQIATLSSEYRQRRNVATEELAAIFAAQQGGQAEVERIDDDTKAVRERALELLNGHAPASMKLYRSGSRDRELRIEVGAIDEVLSALSGKELAARAAEAAEWVERHGAEWRALCRDLVLTATRLQALEQRAQAWRATLGGNVPATLALAEFIGARSVLGIPWANDPLSRVRTAAIDARVVSRSEIKEAQNG
jgi:hypothetical protein